MRVLYFSIGSSIHDYNFLRSLSITDHKIFFLPLSSKVSANILELKNITILGDLKRKNVTLINPNDIHRLKLVLKKIKPDILHAGPIYPIGLLASLSGFKNLLIMSWGYDILYDPYISKWKKHICKFVLNKASVVICDCQSVKNEIINYDFPAESIVVFPWGIDLSLFSNSKIGKNNKLFCEHKKFQILHLRSLNHRMYGIDILSEGFALAAKQNNNIILQIAGHGKAIRKIEKYFRKMGVNNQIHYIGTVNHMDLPEYYKSADLYLSTSRCDGSSVSLLESLACGLPGLVSDIPGNKEWIQEGINGWLFETENAKALSEKIDYAYHQRDKLNFMGESGRNIVEERANWNNNFILLLNAYEKCLQNNSYD